MASEEAAREARRRLGRELAARRRAAGYTQHTFAPKTLYGRSTIANVETGGQRVPRQFWARCDEILGAQGDLLAAFDALDAMEQGQASDPTSLPPRRAPTVKRARHSSDRPYPAALQARPDAVGCASPLPDHADITRLTEALLRTALDRRRAERGSDMPALTAAAAAGRSAYQHARYRQAVDIVAGLIAELDHRLRVETGPQRAQLLVLAATAYQTASGLLLKFDAPALATVAADRSMTAATASEDPVIIAGSSRAVVHALAAGGHPREAVNTAVAAVNQLDRHGDPGDDGLSVRGALLLRAALAAARREDRHTAEELLGEAADTADRLGRDINAASTAFSSTNVVLHHVAAAVHLGDAGTAVHLARTVDLDRLPLPERRAMLSIDVAQAYTQWGKYDRALAAIQAAEHAAPQEVRTRPAVHRMLQDLLRSSPPHLLPRVRRYVDAIGLSA